MEKITIHIADPYDVWREGYRQVLENAGMFVVATSQSAPELTEKMGQKLPDVLLVDAEIAGTEDWLYLHELEASYPKTKIVVTTLSPDKAALAKAIGFGVDAILEKEASAAQLVRTVRG